MSPPVTTTPMTASRIWLRPTEVVAVRCTVLLGNKDGTNAVSPFGANARLAMAIRIVISPSVATILALTEARHRRRRTTRCIRAPMLAHEIRATAMASGHANPAPRCSL